MTTNQLEYQLFQLSGTARALGYSLDLPTLFVDSVYGNKLAYYQHGRNKIVIHEDFVQNGSEGEIVNTLIHELAHAVAEQNNTEKTKSGKVKRVWHGDAWKKINAELGGDAERYHQGGYAKPAPVKKTMAELFAIQPKRPATDWDRGTFKQWLTRGYHVMKGEHGQLTVWEFVADEYETDVDGKTANGYGKAAAMYFMPEQVEANKPKTEGK